MDARSSLPFAVSGKASSTVISEGTMNSGNRDATKSRKTPTLGTVVGRRVTKAASMRPLAPSGRAMTLH